ncbi:MAG TPA: Fe-S cluster assembly protein SufD [Noviherbaspirillum sp.]
MNSAREHYLADYARVAHALPGAHLPWLASARRNALAGFAERGFPTRRDEDWKYTSTQGFERHAFSAAGNDLPNPELALAIARRRAGIELDAHLMVFHNGRYQPRLSTPAPGSGLRLASLADALEAAPDQVEPYLAENADEAEDAFAALNTAFMRDGAYLHLARGTVLEQPVHLLFIATGAGNAHYLRNLIVAERGARASIVEHYIGIDGLPYFTSTVTRIFAEEGAEIAHTKLQQEGQHAFHVARLGAFQQRDSRFASHSISLGAALARHDILARFDGTGCEAALDGLYLAGHDQHVDHHTCVDHRLPHGTSRENYRGVLDGRAHAVFNGKVIVRPGAMKTDASQSNHNLLLSREAEIDAKPELEIYADDVKCNHGATVGQLDAQQLFYLRARGIDEAAARAMLVHAFVHDVVSRIRLDALRRHLEDILLARLPAGMEANGGR